MINEGEHPPVKFGKTGILIVNLGHGILPETKPEMLENLIKIVKNY